MPLLLAASCGPPLIGDEDDDTDPSVGSSVETLDTSITSPTTTVSTTQTPECYSADQCPPNNDCINGQCVYQGYCDEDQYCCYDGGCCAEFGCGYDCYSNYDCGTGYACNYGSCEMVAAEITCNLPSFNQSAIPDAGQVLSLAFLDDGIGGADLLVGRADGITRMSYETGESTPLGSFAQPAYGLATADLDADGDLDVVVASDYVGVQEVQVLHDDGAWTATVIPGLLTWGGVAIADVEADGYPDVYSFGYNGPTFLSFNWGDGWSGATYVTEATGSLAIADIDGDGFEDAVAHSYYTTVISGGAALSVTQLSSGRNFTTSKVVAAGDFDGSGLADVLAFDPGAGGSTLVSAWQAPVLSGSVGADTWWPIPVQVAVAADMNQDGYEDVVVASQVGLGVAFGGVEPAPDVISCLGSTSEGPIDYLAVGDYSGDGRMDIVASDGSSLAFFIQGP